MSLLSEKQKHALRTFFDEYEWVHIALGLTGNFLFFLGSIMFLEKSWQYNGTWLFVAGAFLMFIGSFGNALVKYVSRRNNKKANHQAQHKTA